MQLYRKLVKMKNVIIFLLGKLSREAAYCYVYHTHTTTMAKLREVFIKPSNFQTIILTLPAGRHILNCLSKGKVIPRFWKTHSHPLPRKGPVSHCPSLSTWEHLGSEQRKVFSHSRGRVARGIPALIPALSSSTAKAPKPQARTVKGAAQVPLTLSGQDRKHFLPSAHYGWLVPEAMS